MNSQNKQDQVEEGVHQSHDSADPSLLNDNVPSGSNLSPADKSANQGHISGDEIESKSKNCEDIVHPSNRETPQTMKSKSDSADYLMNSGDNLNNPCTLDHIKTYQSVGSLKSPLAIKQPHKQRKATSIKGPSESSVGFVEEVGTPVFYHPSEDEHPVFDAIDQSTSTEYRSFSPSNLPKVSTGAATAYKPIVEKLEQKEVLLREEKMKDKLGSTSSLSTKSAKTTSKFPYGWNGREFYAEILGTFILMVLNNGIVATYVLRKKGPIDVLAQAYVAGIGAMLGIIVSMPISGGHINPAVTIAFALFKRGGFTWSKVPHYVIGQFLGSFLAQLFLFVTYYDAINDFDGGIRSSYGTNTSTGGIFATFPGGHDPSVLTCIFDQILGTAILLMGVCGITDEHGIKLPPFLQPFFISLLVASLASGMGLNAGAVLNPARDLAPRIFLSLFGYGSEPFSPTGGHYWYAAGVIGPVTGAIIGVFVYNNVVGNHLRDLKLKEEARKKLQKESLDEECEMTNDFGAEGSTEFKAHYTMVNMSGNGKKVHDNNLLINQINHEEQQQQQSFSNQSSQRSSINNGSAKKRNSVLGLTKETDDHR